MRHLPYRLNLDMMASLLRKAPNLNLISKKDRSEKALQLAANYIYRKEPQMVKTLEFMIHAEEYHWLTHGKHVTFFDSTETARAILNSSGNIEDFTSILTEEESFMLALPSDLAIGNTTAQSGLLINIGRHNTREQVVTDPFCYWMGLNNPPELIISDNNESNFGLYCCYQQNLGSHEFMRFAFPASFLPHVMQMQSYTQYREYLAATNKFNYFHGANLDGPQEQYQFDLVRLIAGLLLYRKALPDRIHAGMPSGFRTQNYDSRFIDQQKPQIIHSPARDASHTHGAHYRSWHFRQLMAERYYHGEWESKPRGSRIVFVRDAMVNREIEPETVT